MHAKLRRANVVRDRGRLEKIATAGPECARWFVRMKEHVQVLMQPNLLLVLSAILRIVLPIFPISSLL